MTEERPQIPVALFAYARPDHLRRTLDCLEQNRISLLYAFSDGARGPDNQAGVAEVRRLLREIDWCEVVLAEREENLGLGRSILAGVTAVLARHEAVIVFEDDLICVPGTFDYLAGALHGYRQVPEVMSVTGWTHPRITPRDVEDRPYFDGRAECWVWGTWARAWQGMETDAMSIVRECKRRGIDVHRYGADLLPMAEAELEQNIWAVRFLYHHIVRGGLCLRPPWSMVEHIGFDEKATNFSDGSGWTNPPLRPAPPIPDPWPPAVLHPDCPDLQRRAFEADPRGSLARSPIRLAKGLVNRILRSTRGNR